MPKETEPEKGTESEASEVDSEPKKVTESEKMEPKKVAESEKMNTAVRRSPSKEDDADGVRRLSWPFLQSEISPKVLEQSGTSIPPNADETMNRRDSSEPASPNIYNFKIKQFPDEILFFC